MSDMLYVLGVGRNTITCIDLAKDCGYNVVGLLHYNQERVGESYFDYIISGSFEDLLNKPSLEGLNFVLSMGDISIRRDVYEKIISKGGHVPTLVHPTAIVSPYARLGCGVQIMPFSVVQGDTVIGDNTVITMNTTIAHSSRIDANCFISGHCIVGAYIHVGEGTQIGQGCVLVSGTVNTVGCNSILGAGSVLRNDMKPYSVYLGNPARYIRGIDDQK